MLAIFLKACSEYLLNHEAGSKNSQVLCDGGRYGWSECLWWTTENVILSQNTANYSRCILEAQKKDSLVSGTEERKEWINNLCLAKVICDSTVNKGMEEEWSRELSPGYGWSCGTAVWECCREHRDLTPPLHRIHEEDLRVTMGKWCNNQPQDFALQQFTSFIWMGI